MKSKERQLRALVNRPDPLLEEGLNPVALLLNQKTQLPFIAQLTIIYQSWACQRKFSLGPPKSNFDSASPKRSLNTRTLRCYLITYRHFKPILGGR